MELLTVPFTNRFWTDMYDAVVTVRGVLRTEEDGLVLEFSAQRDYASARKEDDIHTVHVPWPEVQSLTFRRECCWAASLVLRTRSLRALEGLPAAQGNELTVSVSRADRLTARELAANVELALAEARSPRWKPLRAQVTPVGVSPLPSRDAAPLPHPARSGYRACRFQPRFPTQTWPVASRM